MSYLHGFEILLFQYIFDHMILLVALYMYACEIWGFGDNQIINNAHDSFLWQIVG